MTKGQPGPTTLACWALAQVDVASVGPVALPAELAVQHIDALAMIRSGQTCGSDVLLTIRVDEADLSRALIDSGHGVAR